MAYTEDKPSSTELALSAALIPPTCILGGLVGADLWGWFVVPLGVPPIGLWQAAGLSLVGSWLASLKHPVNDGRSSLEILFYKATWLGLAWLIGWALSGLM